MKILWVHNFDSTKNINSGVFMYEQLEQLKAMGLTVDLFCLNRKSLPQVIKDFVFLYKHSKNYDLAHAQYGSFVGFFTSLLPLKKIISLRGTDYYGVPEITWKNKIYNIFSRFFTFNSLKRFDMIITMSNRMSSELMPNHKNVITLTDGIHLNKFINVCSPKVPSKRAKILFSSINKDNPIKRGYLAKEAIEILNKKGVEAELITMTGIKHADVPEFINQCDMVLLTSTHEGWPNIIKECLAINIPFISTDVSDLKEISNTESSCLIVEPIPDRIAEAIIVVLNNRNKGDLDLRKNIMHMDMENYVKELTRFYKTVCV